MQRTPDGGLVVAMGSKQPHAAVLWSAYAELQAIFSAAPIVEFGEVSTVPVWSRQCQLSQVKTESAVPGELGGFIEGPLGDVQPDMLPYRSRESYLSPP